MEKIIHLGPWEVRIATNESEHLSFVAYPAGWSEGTTTSVLDVAVVGPPPKAKGDVVADDRREEGVAGPVEPLLLVTAKEKKT